MNRGRTKLQLKMRDNWATSRYTSHPGDEELQRVGTKLKKSLTLFVKSRTKLVIREDILSKAGGPFIGPRGGKWADAKHTIPWRQKYETQGKRRKEEPKARAERLGIPGLRPWKLHYKDTAYNKAMGTVSEHRLKEGSTKGAPVYKPEREKLHKSWMSSFLTKKDGAKIQPPKPGTQKEAIVMMGGPASGKTTTVKHLLGTKDLAGAGFVNVNPDDIKEMMPEYNEGLKASAKDAAWIAHAESSDVAAKVYNEAIETGLNIIIDGTGKDKAKYDEKIQDLKANGYKIRLMMPDVDIQDARKRSADRAEKTGRFVPDQILIPAHQAIPGNFEPLARKADEFYLYDTRGGKPPPTLKWEGGMGKEDTLHDPAWVAAFKSRSDRLLDQKATAKRKAMSKTLEKSEEKSTDSWVEAEYGSEIKYQGAGKNGNGAVAIVEDVVFPIWVTPKK